MCNSNYSSKWLSDDVQLKQTFPGNTSLRPWNEIRLKNWSISYENLKEIAELISEKTRTVEIKGGEPLYDKRFEYFIDLVLDKNPNVKFNTNTNGMHFTDKNIEMLNRIKKINVDVSVDGTGIFYEWIRSSKWEDFLSNWHNAMQKINHNLNINFTSSVYNIDKIQSMYEFVEETYNTYGYFGTLNFTQIATSPKYQEPKYANKNRIEEGIRQIEIIEKDPANIFVGKSRFYFDKLTALKKYLINCLDFEVSDSEYEKFLKDHNAMVQVRGWDIRDYTNL
jgi:molybdenum cofactor biosynthesis enzyme MoaA